MPDTAPSRQQRHAAIAELLATGDVRNQAELGELLARRGIDVNQATLSRDLRALGVVKSASGYQLLDDGSAAPTAFAGAVRTWVLSATPAQNLVVLKTPPSGANPLALALDECGREEVLGTVAGDDTVFVATPNVKDAKRLAAVLNELAGVAS